MGTAREFDVDYSWISGCQPRPLARKLWERQGQFRKSQAVLEPFVAVLANSRSPSLLVLAKTESMKHGRRRSGTIRRKSVSCYCMGWINLNLQLKSTKPLL
ncbi:hypothetical protein O3P69_019990 [Scylla paramamosain]|uniref:Uncharacterized protein n=1 Tax=Scylla paramamosain TaxID=85552 RepID=A0AAW0SEK3_SCYPA